MRIVMTLAAIALATPALAETQQEARNKAVVLKMWHDVIDGRNIEAAPRYIAKGYIQHSPGVGQGLDAVMAFLRTEFPNAKPLKPGSYPLTKFEVVMADGDLVQLMFKRRLPSSHDAARMVDVWWYDTYRVKDGMLVEHWDSAVE